MAHPAFAGEGELEWVMGKTCGEGLGLVIVRGGIVWKG